MVQLSLSGMYLITKVAFDHGMNHLLFITYRTIIATLILAPCAYIFEREKWPPLSLKEVSKVSLLAFIGIAVSQNCYFAGLYYTSSTFVSSLSNLIPVITFALAFLLRLEVVDMRSPRGQAKVVGTGTCVGGTLILTLLKGPALKIFKGLKKPTSLLLLLSTLQALTNTSNWALGSVLILCSVSAWAGWINYQAWAFKDHPAPISLTSMTCFFGCIQCVILSLIFAHPNDWRLGWDFKLFAYAYSGAFCTAFQFFIQSWCIKKKGPLFAAAFYPVGTLIVAMLEPIFFHIDIYMGSLVGMVLIIGGLYCVLWGKAKDVVAGPNKAQEAVESSISSNATHECHVGIKEPLLR
ncbi:hypothetical protein AMTR_s00055p00110850 [Amborella trichopoda]|uniref:WAT1-related protein n=2 Tax=Amborella trichopoda TaxID=13333 RepID=U5CY23_AMBTC|nr:hypothetical protein AMTR_s00055p00110850 [Amborella trichopoda]